MKVTKKNIKVLEKIKSSVVNTDHFSRFEIYSSLGNGTSPQLIAVGCSFNPNKVVVYTQFTNSVTTYDSYESLYEVYVDLQGVSIVFIDKLINVPLYTENEEVLN